MTKKKKILIGIGAAFLFLAIIGNLIDTSENSSTNIPQQKQEAKKEEFNLQALQQNVGAYWTTVSKEGDTLDILIAPIYETSKKPSAPNIAAAIYNLATNLCPSSYPTLGKIKLKIGWKDSKNNPPKVIAVLEGTKADFCVGYERAKEKPSDILAGYVMMNNFFSFPKKQVKDQQALQQICQSDYIQKFCRELQQ